MKKGIKFFGFLLSFLLGLKICASEERYESGSQSVDQKSRSSRSPVSDWFKKFDSSSKPTAQKETASEKKDSSRSSAPSSNRPDTSSVNLSDGPQSSKKSGKSSGASSNSKKDQTVDQDPSLYESYLENDSYNDDLAKKKKSSKDKFKKSKKSTEEENRDDNAQLMSKTKNSLFDDFSHLKSDEGIQSFKKLSRDDIRKRVSGKVDAISQRVNFSVEQENMLKNIMENHLLDLQDKLKGRKVAATPEEVARELFNGVDGDSDWDGLKFSEKQRDLFEDYVMKQSEIMKNGSLLEDYLRLCSKMSKKAEAAATDARLAGEVSKGSIMNKLKVGANRVKATGMMAANPCILSVLLLGIVGEFIYSKV